jgi:hypothetical protein
VAYAAREMPLRPSLVDARMVLAVAALYGFAVATIERHLIALVVVASFAVLAAWQRWQR